MSRASYAGLDWDSVEALSDDELTNKLYGVDKPSGKQRAMPDFAALDIERRKPGVTPRYQGGAPFVTAIKVYRFVPVNEEADRQAAAARQVALSIRGVFGGFWTGDGVDGTEAVDGAMMGGLSVRVTKGMLHNIAFEGGRSGDALFRDVMYEAMQGDVRRRASFGRVQAAGVIRFGTRRVFSTRLGAGIQGTNYDSRFIVGGVSREGPGNSLEGGVHIGYRWNP